MVFLKTHDLIDLVDGSVSPPPVSLFYYTLNPTYTVWLKRDTYVLSWLLASITEKLSGSIKKATPDHHSSTRFYSEFMEETKTLVDQLAVAGKTTDDQDLISFLLRGLRPVFNPFVTSFNFARRHKDFSFDNFQAELLSFETLIDSHINLMLNQHYDFATTHNRKPPFIPRKLRSPMQPSKLQLYNSSSPLNKGNHFPHTTRATNRPNCQICDKRGHIALDCYHHFDFSYQGRLSLAKLVAMVVESHPSYDQSVCLYPFAGDTSSSNKLHCFTTKLFIRTFLEICHNRLGLPA
ncbi:hypothetical protein SADUNF_Sadunf08G0161300 [Salix dunnii]|uniref:CCHC-type domain-containing protein n=1 Tax=Salix dunnii TaxID=1413687 RepID=A0A835K1J5_9ROSI|nr:hypothetical protein SADUNF_Sadunf08G0161300 [Salix dunnii]